MPENQNKQTEQKMQIGFVSLFVNDSEQSTSPTLHLCSNGCWSTSCFQNG